MALSREIELGVGIVIAVLVIASILLGPSAGVPSDSQKDATEEGGSEESAPVVTTDLSLTVDDVGFSHSTLTAPAGIVVLTVTNAGPSTHGFTLLEFNIDQIIPAGQSRTFTFTAAAGTYTFADTIVPSRTGTLSVT